MRHPDDLVTLFRERGLKVTPQRRALFAVLHDDQTHPSADAVFHAVSERLPGISLRTVYQILSELADLGEIQVLDLGTGSARFDPNVGDHHHLVCHDCGAVRDVHVDLTGLPTGGDAFGGFVVDRPQVIYRGRCTRCAGSDQSPATAGRSAHPPN